MKFQVILYLAGILSFCSCVPVYQPQIGIFASNSNEILRLNGLNGLTLAGLGLGQAQGPSFFSPFMIQPQLPQVLNFNPSVPGPFLPPQINQLNPAQLPPLQQEQPVNRLGPNNAIPAQNPAQAFPYFLNNLYPLRNTPVWLPPNQIPGPNIQQQSINQPIQPVQNGGKAADPSVTAAPDYRGDRPGPGTVEFGP
ncbi:uncharacterized protein odam [Triplophysa rosa]|uniref:uncharacterized protein odam n=1 Tax=Triplophysa rosa TaxID=992332 RepID=UPI002545FA3F|nr:uncharacterized protein odam [Triplophysa rosa]